jgi:outer membrane biosynthesis protein TonB
MSLETVIQEHTVALNALTAAIVANTETMRSLVTATPANVVPITPAAKPKTEPKAKPAAKETPDAPEPEAPAEVVEETPEPEAPTEVVEETPEPEAPTEVVEETPVAEDGEPEYRSWDEVKLKLATQEYIKTRLADPKCTKEFKDSFAAELARYGVQKATNLKPEERLPFYEAALTWG